MKGWLILSVTLAMGIALGVGAMTKGPAVVAPYLPKSISGQSERIEGEVVRKQRDGNRLLVKITTTQGPALVTFTQKVADLDVLLDPGDTITLVTAGRATFIDDPVLERVQRRDATNAPLPSAPPGTGQSPPR